MKSITKNQYINAFYFLFVLVVLIYFIKSISSGYAKESWQLTELLINYQGGFVRRGLLGECLFFLYNQFGLNPYYTAIVLCIAAYLCLIVFFIKAFIKKSYTLFILPFIFFLGNPVINNFWLKKDILLILFYFLIIHFAVKKSGKYMIVSNILLVISFLIHESIGFFGLPILMLLLIHKNRYSSETTSFINATIRSIAQLTPSCIAFATVLYFKGSHVIAQAIWNSWQPITFPFQEEQAETIPAAIDGLSWSLNKGLSLSLSMLDNFDGGIYAPLGWWIIITAIYYILTHTDKLNIPVLSYRPLKSFDKTTISNILIFQFIMIVPLYILGWDYARWIFLWVASSLGTVLLVPEHTLSVLFPRIITVCSQRINVFLDSVLSTSKGFVTLVTLLIGFPPCCWNVYVSMKSGALFMTCQFVSKRIEDIFILVKEML